MGPNASAPRGHDNPRPGDPRRALGRLGEDLAVHHLEHRGLQILDRNVRTRHGEIDIIAVDNATLVFVEVKTRRANASQPRRRESPGSRRPSHLSLNPLEGLRMRQQLRLRQLARAWLAERHTRPRARELRFDAIGVVVDRSGALLRLDHVEGAW